MKEAMEMLCYLNGIKHIILFSIKELTLWKENYRTISFITPTNYNRNVITRGSEQDTNGICIAGDGNAGFANMVFYKLILYPKTIPLLQINFLKNLMERDEIIDLNNPIFIKNE